MSGKATGWVLQQFPIRTQGDRNRKLVLLSVADAANAYGETARMAVDVVCEEWGFDGGTVRRHLRDLIAEGWLEVEQESRGRGGPKVYRLPGMARSLHGNPEAIGAQSQTEVRANTTADTSIPNNGSNGAASEDLVLVAFLAWWAEYPRREDKKKAEKCYRARTRAGCSSSDMLAAARQYAREVEGRETRYMKLAATFLAEDDGPWREALERSRRPAGREDGPVSAQALAENLAPVAADDPRLR